MKTEPAKPYLIAVTGPDGSGKSTVIEKTASAWSNFAPGRAVSCSVWDALGDSKIFTAKSQVDEYLKKLSGESRLIFIAHALSHALDKAAMSRPTAIVTDGYIYKYAVNELARGTNPGRVTRIIDFFDKPDLTLFLDIGPDEASRRKKLVSEYESRGDFVTFQKTMAPHWVEVENKTGPWTHIDGGQDQKIVARQVQSAIETFFEGQKR